MLLNKTSMSTAIWRFFVTENTAECFVAEILEYCGAYATENISMTYIAPTVITVPTCKGARKA